MLIKAKELRGYALHGTDGEIGKVDELYFDDQHWTVRYLVVDTGNWLVGRQVLISPHAVAAVSKEDERISIALSRKQVEDSPSLDSDKPVSRQFEEAYYGFYGWPGYWTGPYMWGPYWHIVREPGPEDESADAGRAWDPTLRSTHDVTGHHVHATDGDIGHVDDFVIDEETWAIRYLVIDTRNWLPGKLVLVSPKWIERVSWEESKIYVNLPRKAIEQSPEYSEEFLITRDYETGLHSHYDRAGYWTEEPDRKEPPR